MPAKVLDIDLYSATEDVAVAGEYPTARTLVRWDGEPLVEVDVAVVDHIASLAEAWASANTALGDELIARVVEAVVFGKAGGIPAGHHVPSCSVVVCTRDRPRDLERCLDAIMACRPRPSEIVVVDNAPSDDASARVCSHYPVSYVLEPRPGLNWARTHAAAVATGDIVLFTDDDVVVDERWVGVMCAPFEDPEVAAVTGLVLALELETPAQCAFERYAGFGRGFRTRRFTASNLIPAAAGNAGAGASMALRRALVTELGLFAHEIDCGTAARSGGDNYAFYLLLRHGHAIVYTPRAVCRHRHRRTEDELVATLHGYSVGVFAFLLRCLVQHRDLQAVRVGASWLVSHHLRNTARALAGRPDAIPLRYTLAELRGVAAALPAYFATRRVERRFEAAGSARAESA